MKRIRATKEKAKVGFEKASDLVMHWIGSPSSLFVHTLFFIACFLLPTLRIVSFENVLLVLTTIVSLEAIYLAIFIQIAVNRNTADIEEIQEDIESIEENVDEIQEDIEEDTEHEETQQERDNKTLTAIQHTLTALQKELEELKKK